MGKGWLRGYFTALGYGGLVFSYLWRVVGMSIIVVNTWQGVRDPNFREEWVPLWVSPLLLIGVFLIGHMMARFCAWWISGVTGRPPWR